MKREMKKIIDRFRKNVPSWANLQNLVFFIVIFAFVVIVIWSESISYYISGAQPVDTAITITPEILPGTPTPLPEEWIRSAHQTNGIISGAVIIIITIIAGTTAILLRDRDQIES